MYKTKSISLPSVHKANHVSKKNATDALMLQEVEHLQFYYVSFTIKA